MLTNALQGLGELATTIQGISVILGAIIVIAIAVIKKSKTTKDDEWLARFGPVVFGACEKIEALIPDGTQIEVLKWVDGVCEAIAGSGKVDVSDKKLMTVIKGELIKVAKVSAKVDTSDEKLAELKN